MYLLTILKFFALFALINTEHANHKYNFAKRLKFDGNEMKNKRYLDLVRFAQNANNFTKVINHDDIIGTIPSNFLKNFDINATDETFESSPSEIINHDDILGMIPSNFFNDFDINATDADETYDSLPSESINIVQVDPQDIKMGESIETPQILPYDSQNFFPTEAPFPPYESQNFFPIENRVKVHVFRGPNMRYWIQGKHGRKQKYYSNWGYIIKQPSDNF